MQKQAQNGYTLIELVIAMAVGSIVLAGSYVSYDVVNREYTKMANISEVQTFGIATLNLVVKDLRLAGRRAVDGNIESSFTAIATPISITDSNDACCDQVSVTYDTDLTTRSRITYFVQARTTGTNTRNALYMDIEDWDGAAWTNTTNDALVADYIEDFQIVGSDMVNGFATLVDIFMIFRSRNFTAQTVAYTKPDYEIGNYNFTANDNYRRDEFSATINLRNVK